MLKLAALLVLLAGLSISTQAENLENDAENVEVGRLMNSLTSVFPFMSIREIKPAKTMEYTKWVVKENKNWFFEKIGEKKWVFIQNGRVTNHLDEVSSQGSNLVLFETENRSYFQLTENALYRVQNINNPNKMKKTKLLNGHWVEDKPVEKNQNLKWKFSEYVDTYLEKVSDSEWIVTEQGRETDRLVEISLVNHRRLGLVVVLLDKDGEYYRLTKDTLYSGKSIDDIRSPRNRGTWVNPEVIMPPNRPTTTTTPRPIRTTTRRPIRITTTRPIRTTTTTALTSTTTTQAMTTTKSMATTTGAPTSNRLKWVFDVPKGWFFEKRTSGWILNQDGQIFRMREVSVERNLKGPVVVLEDSNGQFYRLTEGQLLEGNFKNLQLKFVAAGRWENL